MHRFSLLNVNAWQYWRSCFLMHREVNIRCIFESKTSKWCTYWWAADALSPPFLFSSSSCSRTLSQTFLKPFFRFLGTTLCCPDSLSCIFYSDLFCRHINSFSTFASSLSAPCIAEVIFFRWHLTENNNLCS